MLGVTILPLTMLNVIMLSVVMLSAVIPVLQNPNKTNAACVSLGKPGQILSLSRSVYL
jgi:hypothetical protein